MKELEQIQFFQLRPSLRVKKFSSVVRNTFERRKNTSETFEQKQARIKAIAEKINKKLCQD